jgi:hypothetical protein
LSKIIQNNLLQPHTINSLEAKFGKEVEGKKANKTPGTQMFKIISPNNDDENIMDSNLQTRHRPGVEILLFLTKHSRPDICNIVRELSGTYLVMLRLIKSVIDTEHFDLKVCLQAKIKNWSLHVFSYSDWAGNSKMRISITGFMIYLMNVPIC